MKLIKVFNNYINDDVFKIIYKDKYLNIINYTKIIDFSSSFISIMYNDNIYNIEGNNLTITKMMDNEILIEGDINRITFS